MKEPMDPRSTWRRRAQKILEEVGRPYYCEHCGKVPQTRGRSQGLEVNHVNKVLSDIDPVNLEYLCKSCHKKADQVTGKGVSPKGDEHGYGY